MFYIIKSYSLPGGRALSLENFFYRIHIEAKKEEDGWSKMVQIIQNKKIVILNPSVGGDIGGRISATNLLGGGLSLL